MADPAEGAAVPFHLPVLLAEVVGQLGVRPDGVFVDATVGDGGHALSLLQASSPTGSVCGIDLDPRSLVRANRRLASFGERFTPLLGSYAEMVSLVQGIWGAEARADGVLLDLGISSRQVDATGFGFSFQRDEPLDMRFNPEADIPTAADIVNTWSETRLAAVIREYGEEPRARAIAAAIARRRPLNSTAQLARVVAEVSGAEERARSAGQRRQKARQDPPGHPHFPGPAHRGKRRVDYPGRRAGRSGGIAGSGRAGSGNQLPQPGGPVGQELHGQGGGAVHLSAGAAHLRMRAPAQAQPGKPAGSPAHRRRGGGQPQEPERPDEGGPAAGRVGWYGE